MGLKDAASRWVRWGATVVTEGADDFRAFLVQAVAEGARDAVVALVKNLLKSAVNAVGTGFTIFVLCTQFGIFCKVFGIPSDGGGANDGEKTTTTTENVVEGTTIVAEETTETVVTRTPANRTVEETVTRIGETLTTETTAGPTVVSPPDRGIVPAELLSDQVLVVVLAVFVISFVLLGIRAQRA